MDRRAEVEALRALNRVQVEFVSSFLGECCVGSRNSEDERLWYVTYDTGPTSIRSAFRQWLVDKGHSPAYELPSSRSPTAASFKCLIGVHLKTEVQAVQGRHRHHGALPRGAYRGVRLANIDPQYYLHPLADRCGQGAIVRAFKKDLRPIGWRGIDLLLVILLACLQRRRCPAHHLVGRQARWVGWHRGGWGWPVLASAELCRRGVVACTD